MPTKCIMTVDDSITVRQMVSNALREAGYEVIEAVDGSDALTKLVEDIALVLCDVNMPMMDGLTLVKHIRADKRYQYIPIVMLTTETQADRRKLGKEVGATGWIVKPFTAEKLVAVVRKFVK
ncbi:response regulator [Desulfovibrio inopinatus]|uniref:response regulator n=1 Tax=Desulfovibrio inopinatus TaxID=102109 RepID=UPI00054D23E9|nr:response regulator [Desulfovibrio inopinatus]